MPASPTHSRAEGQGLRFASARQPASFTIYSYDENGRRLKTGGEVYALQARGGGRVTHSIHDNLDGSYSVEWSAMVSGAYSLIVMLNGRQIVGSPFGVQVLQRRAEASTSFVRGNMGQHAPHRAVAGEPSALYLEFCDALGAPSSAEELALQLEERPSDGIGVGSAGSEDEEVRAIEREERALEATRVRCMCAR